MKFYIKEPIKPTGYLPILPNTPEPILHYLGRDQESGIIDNGRYNWYNGRYNGGVIEI
jgi:hypothetical protein